MRRHQSQSPAECFRCPQLSIGFVSVDAPSLVAKSSFASPRVFLARTGCCASWAIASRLGIHLGCRGIGRSHMLGETGISPGGHSECVFLGFQNFFVGSFLLRAVCLKNLSEAVWAAFQKISELFWLSYVFRSVALQNFVVGYCLVRALCPQNFPEARGARLPLTFWAN